METCEEIRLANARLLINKVGGMAEFARLIKTSDSQASQFAGENPTRNIGHKKAREIERFFKMERGWLDHIHDAQPETMTKVTPEHGSMTVLLPDELHAKALQWLEIGKNALTALEACFHVEGNKPTPDTQGKRKQV